jgi:guanylate kinase
MADMAGHIFLLVGPSGGGKTTLIRRVLSDGREPAFRFVPSTTSRPPRPGEREGVDYHFAGEEEFDRLIAGNDFLEWQRVHGYRYGSSRSRLLAAVRGGHWGITTADILGAFKIEAALAGLVTTVFVTPSDLDILRQRILDRGPVPEEELERRLGRVAMEMQLAHACSRLVLNDDLDEACERLRAIALAQARAEERLRHFRRRPVVRMVEVAPPPTPECGTRFCVADCETAAQAAERVLHQWWWELHPSAVRFELPPYKLVPEDPPGPQYCETASAILEVTRWRATTPDGRPWSEVAGA